MNRYQITDEGFLNQVKQWIETDGEVYAEIYFARSGGMTLNLLVTSYDEFTEALSRTKETNKHGEVWILRNPNCKLRGVANETLLDQIFTEISDGTYWILICPDSENIWQTQSTSGFTHKEIKEGFDDFKGKYIVVGFNDTIPPTQINERTMNASFG